MPRACDRDERTQILTISTDAALARCIAQAMRSVWIDPSLQISTGSDFLQGAGEMTADSRERFDLVMLDLSACRPDATKAISAIRRLPWSNRTALVAIGDTGDDPEMERELLYAGADFVVRAEDLRRKADEVASLVFDRWFAV